MRFIILVALFFAAVFAATNQPSGVKVIVKSSGINEVVKNLIPELVQDLKSLKLDDISGTTHVAVVGDINYTMVLYL
jgi:hypothetical protein